MNNETITKHEPLRRSFLLPSLIFLGMAAWILRQSFLNFGEVIPGAPVSDLWNGLWSFHFIQESMQEYRFSTWTNQLNYPHGGSLVPADIFGGILFALFSPLGDIGIQYTMVVFVQLFLAALGASLLFREIYSNVTVLQSIVVGVLVQLSPMMLTSIHNGSTEVMSIGMVLLAINGYLRFFRGEKWGLILVLSSIITSWYGVLMLLSFMCCHSLLHRRSIQKRHCNGFLIYAFVLIPYALFFLNQSSQKGNLIGIKSKEELALIRRTIGSSDPLSYLLPHPYISPDFSFISRYQEQFVHSSYVGLSLVALFVIQIIRNSKRKMKRDLLMWGVLGFFLSLGPVLVIQAEPFIAFDRGIPLPYFLVEKLPGFSSLSLLYRFSLLPFLALLFLSIAHLSSRVTVVFAIVFIIEAKCIAPSKDLPYFSSMPHLELQEEMDGAVGEYPITAGRASLFLQTEHNQPVLRSLNFSLNAEMKLFLDYANSLDVDSSFAQKVENYGKEKGIRYLLFNRDPSIMPDQYFLAMEEIFRQFPTISRKTEYKMVKLY